jgi:hypothetical protein
MLLATSFQTALPPVEALAVVLGSPLGFEKSVTARSVSGLHRSMPGSARESPALIHLIQTDAPISPGNSGGAIVDGQGRVIDISEAYIPADQSAVPKGFAIPAATAVSMPNQLLRPVTPSMISSASSPAELTAQLAREFGPQETWAFSCTASRPPDRLTKPMSHPVTSWLRSREAAGNCGGPVHRASSQASRADGHARADPSGQASKRRRALLRQTAVAVGKGDMRC